MAHISWQRIDVHPGMTDQRNSLLDRLGPHESVTLRGAVLIGGDGKGDVGHGEKVRERWLTVA